MPGMTLTRWIIWFVIGLAIFGGVRVTLGSYASYLLTVVFLVGWFVWNLLNMKRCDTCGKLIKPWQGGVNLRNDVREFSVHPGCPFTT